MQMCRICAHAQDRAPSRAPVNGAPPQPGPVRTLFFWLVLATVALLLAEVGLRVVAAWRVGPSLLFYGTPWHRNRAAEQLAVRSVFRHENEAAGYTKYFPNQTLHDMNPRVGDLFDVHINSRGFRGADVADEKAPHTIRIVTLGASSTFGYGSRDDETYPSVLERLLNDGCAADVTFQVINLGIPHQTSGQILSIFRTEAVPLHPDFVTFYEGANDTVQVPTISLRASLKSVDLLHEALRFLRAHVMLLVFIDSAIDTRTRTFDAEQVRRNLEGKEEIFLANLSQLRDECARRGITLLVASQQLQSQTIRTEEITGVSYAQEVALVERNLAERGWVGATEQWLLIHSHLMEGLESWAHANDVPFVDVIRRLDDDRSVLMSWVHLTPAGNRRVAQALAEAILPLACPAARP
jgi:lysophospholipase L1-like esterase